MGRRAETGEWRKRRKRVMEIRVKRWGSKGMEQARRSRKYNEKEERKIRISVRDNE